MILVTAPERKRAKMNRKTQAFLVDLVDLLDAEREFWPVTVRRVFYAYIGRYGLKSDIRLYQRVSNVLYRARLEGVVPWEAVEDRTRATVGSQVWPEASAFVEAWREAVLTGYRRDLQQDQAQRLEVWVEKDALAPIVGRAADPYTVRVSIARGFSSGSFKREAAERIRLSAEQGQRTVILYFGDLDPSGAFMPVDIRKTLDSDFGLGDLVDVYHCGLLPEQVTQHGLPSSPDAMKASDSRTPWFRKTYPEQDAVELDALPARALLELVRESIEAWLDPSVLDAARAEQDAERAEVEDLRGTVVAAFGDRR